MWLVIPAAAWLVALAAFVWFLRSPALRERRKGMWVAAIVAGLFAVGGVALLGLPGAVIYELCVPWVRLMLGARFADLGDGAWPAALIITLTWPASLVVAYVLANGPLRHRSRLLRWAVLILLPYGFGVLLALWAHLSAL